MVITRSFFLLILAVFVSLVSASIKAPDGTMAVSVESNVETTKEKNNVTKTVETRKYKYAEGTVKTEIITTKTHVDFPAKDKK